MLHFDSLWVEEHEGVFVLHRLLMIQFERLANCVGWLKHVELLINRSSNPACSGACFIKNYNLIHSVPLALILHYKDEEVA